GVAANSIQTSFGEGQAAGQSSQDLRPHRRRTFAIRPKPVPKSTSEVGSGIGEPGVWEIGVVLSSAKAKAVYGSLGAMKSTRRKRFHPPDASGLNTSPNARLANAA